MKQNILLINKYKPNRFCDFVDHETEPILAFLKTQIEKNKILTMIVGEEETGKTTMLNTIIGEYYGAPPSSCISNVLYIHYLKEQGTSYYKNEVKYFCQTYCSIPGKKKTVVLDDFDFMTEANQTVFVNIIDKYSKYVNFIGSCKLLHKILYGIQTRLMLVRLPRLTHRQLSIIANKIIHEEGLIFEENALESLITVSKHKINRLINCIDKIKLVYGVSCYKEKEEDTPIINSDVVYQLCANIQYTIYKQYFTFILERKITEAIGLLYDLHDKGFSVIDILDNMFEYTKMISSDKTENVDNELDTTSSVFFLQIEKNKVYEIIKIICKYITFFYNIHEDEIELALITNDIIFTLYI
jgi:DNA polymerase III delta prime subunit